MFAEFVLPEVPVGASLGDPVPVGRGIESGVPRGFERYADSLVHVGKQVIAAIELQSRGYDISPGKVREESPVIGVIRRWAGVVLAVGIAVPWIGSVAKVWPQPVRRVEVVSDFNVVRHKVRTRE